jgi:hypothetical protein
LIAVAAFGLAAFLVHRAMQEYTWSEVPASLGDTLGFAVFSSSANTLPLLRRLGPSGRRRRSHHRVLRGDHSPGAGHGRRSRGHDPPDLVGET